MRLFVALAVLPLARAKSVEETSASQGVATRIPLARTNRYRPPTIAAPHAFKVFDERITREEFLGVKAKYRDAERFIRGAVINPPIKLPSVYESSGNTNVGRDAMGLSNNPGQQNIPFGPLWMEDLQPRVNCCASLSHTNTSYPRGKRRCGGEAGVACDLQRRSGQPIFNEDRLQPEPLESPFAETTLDNVSLSPIPFPMKPDHNKDERQVARMEMIDHIVGGLDVLYYGPLNFGWPPQAMTVDIDTGSADLWVPIAECPSCNSRKYEHIRSVTYNDTKNPFQVVYGSGWAKGSIAQDHVTLGNFTSHGQYFGAVTEVSDDFRGSPASGVLGMAFGTISTTKQSPFFESLIMSTKLASPLFAVHLTRGKEKGSELCLGCMDATKFSGEVYWISVKSKAYWFVAMTGHSVGGNTHVYNTPITAAIDTGSTLIYLPINVADALYKEIPGSRPAAEYGEAIWTYPCSSRLQLALRFEDRLFQIHPWDFNLGRTDPNSDQCVGGVLGLPDDFPNDFAIIGDEFLKNWYSAYDYRHDGKVGLAYSVNNK